MKFKIQFFGLTKPHLYSSAATTMLDLTDMEHQLHNIYSVGQP